MKQSAYLIAILVNLSVNAKVFNGALTLNDDVKADVAVAYFKHDDYMKVPVKVDQIRRVFLQALYVTQPGVDVTLANSDRSRHNIFINDLDLGLKLNTGIMRQNQSKDFPVNWQEGYIVRMGCFMHSTMTSYLANIPSNYYDAMVFDNNHPINPFIVKPVNYAFQIQVPDNFNPRELNLILPYRKVDPIAMNETAPAVYDIKSEGRTIGQIEIKTIKREQKKSDLIKGLLDSNKTELPETKTPSSGTN